MKKVKGLSKKEKISRSQTTVWGLPEARRAGGGRRGHVGTNDDGRDLTWHGEHTIHCTDDVLHGLVHLSGIKSINDRHKIGTVRLRIV